MRQQTAAIPRIEVCQVVLDEEGRITACAPDAADKLGAPDQQVQGKRFRELLLSINPEWDDLLPEQPHNWNDGQFLPWRNDGTCAEGLRIHLMSIADQQFVTIIPDLAEDLESQKVGDLELGAGPAASRRLLLRLRAAESRLKNYEHNYPGILYSQRPDLSFSYIGAGFENLVEAETMPLLRNGNSFLDLILESDRQTFIAELEKNSTRGEAFGFSYRIRTRTRGSIIYLLDVRLPILSPGGLLLGYEGVWMDITRQSIAENRLSRTAWKESLATITSGLIHDFSNIMAGIFSLSELYHSSLEDDHPWKRGMGQIMDSSRHARKLVRRIIDLNREAAGQANYHNLEALLNDQLDLIRAILSKQATLETHFTGEELPVWMDDVSFRQMILNLAMNSRDAIGNDGRIEISTRKVCNGESLFEDTPFGSWKAPREGVLITFSDNGCGIEQGHLQRIFDAFFTTKEASKGSGFGLYNARLFTTQCKGRITAKSRPGEGTTFYIYLPLADFTEALADERASIPETVQRPAIVIYSGFDVSNFELVSRMHEKEWELISFTRPEALRRYLREAPRSPSVFISMMIGQDPISTSLLHEVSQAYPDIKRALLLIGNIPDAVPLHDAEVADAVLDDSLSYEDLIREIEICMQK